jgi:dCTP diphosphatase
MNNLQQTIKNYLIERSWDNLELEDLAKSISIESSELLELFQWSKSFKLANSNQEIKNNPELLAKVKSELADVLMYAIDACIMLDVDYEEVVLTKLEKVKTKYPVDTTSSHDDYLAIKKEYRTTGKNEL